MILLSIFITSLLSVLQIKGNLDSAKRFSNSIYTSVMWRSRMNLNPAAASSTVSIPANVDNGQAVDPDIYRQKEDEEKWRFLTLFKIMMNFLQTVAAGVALDLSWTDGISRLLESWDWIGGAAVESTGFTMDCLLPADASTPRAVMRQILVIFLPIFVLFILFAYWVIRTLALDRGGYYLGKRCILTLVVVLYVSYISLTKAAINTFYCVRIYDGYTLEDVEATHRFWVLDTKLPCFEDSHLNLAIFVASPLLLFAFVYPALLAVILVNVRRRDKLETETVKETLGFFFRGFEKRYVYWDCVILLRKALLAAVVVFSYSLGGNLQGLSALTVLVGALFFQTTLSPFKHRFEYCNQLESLSLFVSSFTILAGIILSDNNMTSSIVEGLLVATVFISNLGLAVALFFLLVHVKCTQIRYGLLAEGVKCETWNDYSITLEYSFHTIAKLAEAYEKTLVRIGWMEKKRPRKPNAPVPEVELPNQIERYETK